MASFRIKGHKYNAKKTKCSAGHNHDSAFEAGYCDTLHFMLKTKQIKNVICQHKVSLVVNGCLICRHIIDFLVTNNDGLLEFHEVKGYETPDWKLKKALTEAIYPDIKYIVIKKGKK